MERDGGAGGDKAGVVRRGRGGIQRSLGTQAHTQSWHLLEGPNGRSLQQIKQGCGSEGCRSPHRVGFTCETAGAWLFSWNRAILFCGWNLLFLLEQRHFALERIRFLRAHVSLKIAIKIWRFNFCLSCCVSGTGKGWVTWGNAGCLLFF